MVSTLVRSLLLCTLLLTWLPAIALCADEDSSLDSLVREALQNNPELQAAAERYQQFRYKIPQANSLDDPMLSFAFSNYPTDTYSSDDTPMTGNELRLAQKFPWPGKLGAREDQAKEQAAWYEAVYRDGRYQLARKVKDAWYRLYYQERAIEVVEQNLALVDDVIRLTETRYEVGQGLQQDVLKAQVERSRLLDRLIKLRQQRSVVLANLNTLLNRSPSSPLETPQEVELVSVDLTVEELQAAAEQQRPLFDAYRSLNERFRAQGRLADLNYWPDVTLWAGYRFRDDNLPDDGTDFVSAGFSINLPVYRGKRDAAAAEADAGLRVAQRRFDDFRGKVLFNIHDAYSGMEQKQEQAELYREGLVPQATQTFSAAMSSYQVGKVQFLSLLDALMKLYNYEMDYFRIQSEYLRSVARLEAESGVSLFGPDLAEVPAPEKE